MILNRQSDNSSHLPKIRQYLNDKQLHINYELSNQCHFFNGFNFLIKLTNNYCMVINAMTDHMLKREIRAKNGLYRKILVLSVDEENDAIYFLATKSKPSNSNVQ